MAGKHIGYARVSTTGQTLDEQCERVFQEELSGATRKRPALADMLDFVRDGDTVYITKLDRLARNTLDLHNIVDVLDKKSVGFVVIDQPEIDTTSRSAACCLRSSVPSRLSNVISSRLGFAWFGCRVMVDKRSLGASCDSASAGALRGTLTLDCILSPRICFTHVYYSPKSQGDCSEAPTS